MSNTYTIKKLDDFLKIPEDRLDACLTDFKLGVINHRKMQALFQETAIATFPKASKEDFKLSMGHFKWIDDGKHNITMSIKQPPEASAG